MALAHIYSIAFIGVEAVVVDVEVDVKNADKLSLILVGLPDTAVKESKDRVLTAIANSGFKMDNIHCTVNLAPGDLKKEGPLYDLPIAFGILASQGILPSSVQQDYLCVGELSLSGQTRPMRGALSVAILARQLGKKGVLLPWSNAQEAALVPDIDIIGIKSLSEACQFFQNPSSYIKPALPPRIGSTPSSCIDLADIKGQVHAKRALEIAAAGGHNLLLFGPPGSGKTLLAKAVTGILPPLTLEEILEITKIHSIAGILPEGKNLVDVRPFRSPHHTISAIGLVGGGSTPRPGEISLAHQGILFLDELPEFTRTALEVLRQPLENRNVTITRANATTTFPTSCICIAAMNPCPCGFLGHPKKRCLDTPMQIQRYRNKISGPLLDRIDMHVEVPALSFEELRFSSTSTQEMSSVVQNRVVKARKKQQLRLGSMKTNALMSPSEMKQFCPLSTACEMLMRQAIDKLGISARAYHRIVKIARTIADLSEEERIEKNHLMEAISFRSWEQK